MLDALQVTDSPARIAAVIRFKIPPTELPGVMGPAIDELMAAVKAQGITPTGPLFNHYLSMDSGMFDFEVGVPISSEVAPTGRVRPGELPAARVARATYTGPYSGLHHAWREFDAMARAQGYKPIGGHPCPRRWAAQRGAPAKEPQQVRWGLARLEWHRRESSPAWTSCQQRAVALSEGRPLLQPAG
jgi:effector-binding domain-containing protein